MAEPRKPNPKLATEKTYSDVHIPPNAQELAEDQVPLDGEW